MNKRLNVLIPGFLFIAACGTQPQATSSELPAIIPSVNDQATAKISEAINSLLNKNSVAVAEDAFTESDLLIVHRRQLLGRDLDGSVERFRLVKQSEACIVIHENTGNRQNLEGVTCDLLAGVE